MSTGMLRKSQAKCPRPEDGPRYVFIRNGNVVAHAATQKEAIGVWARHKSAQMFDRSHYANVTDLRRCYDEYRKSPQEWNNAAYTLCQESQGEFCFIESCVTDLIPGACMDGPYPNVQIKVDGKPDRPATNEEGAMVDQMLWLNHDIDLRKDLRKQTAEWLESVARALLQAAAKIGAGRDERKKKTIRALVNDPDFLDRMKRDGLYFGYDMELLTAEEYEQEFGHRPRTSE